MNRGENSDSIPNDLILDILSRLPAKSIQRFRCVSKLWKSMLSQSYFTELFLNKSSSRPRLLFVGKQDSDWLFFSSPQPQNLDEKSSLVVADCHMKFSKDINPYNCTYASGLIYFHNTDNDAVRVICNPSTGQYAILPLPERRTHRHSYSYLGFDPIDKEFKVLLISTSKCIASSDIDHYILTLGTEKLRWRKIQCPFTHLPLWNRICINGVLYYLALSERRYYAVVCFDVRSEKFKLVELEYRLDCRICGLINYKGKLCGVNLKYAYYGGFPLELRMWVLEDVEKEEWTTYAYTLSADIKVVKVNNNLIVAGVTASGEIVLVNNNTCKPFYVFYFNPERKTFESVEIQFFGANGEAFKTNFLVYAFIDHVEDLKFDIKTTTYAAYLEEDHRTFEM
ncbi:F-box associated domain type 3, partial [Arabidopsis suecica]